MAVVEEPMNAQLLSPTPEQSIGLEASPSRSALSEISLEVVSRREKLSKPKCALDFLCSEAANLRDTTSTLHKLSSILKQGNSPQAIRARLKRRRTRRKVRFAPETKSWDGICNLSGNSDLDDLLFRFFCMRKKICREDILEWTERDVPRLQRLCDAVLKLCSKLERIQGQDSTIPCLPKGGGKALKVHPTDLPSLHKLHKVIFSALTLAKGKRKLFLSSSNRAKRLATPRTLPQSLSL